MSVQTKSSNWKSKTKRRRKRMRYLKINKQANFLFEKEKTRHAHTLFEFINFLHSLAIQMNFRSRYVSLSLSREYSD